MTASVPTPSGWRRRSIVAPGVHRIEEPFVTPWFSANIFVVEGCDADLVIDTGTGMVPLCPDLPLRPGKTVLGLATHIHCDHAGALHEFEHRLGPAREAAMFAEMADEDTRAFRLREVVCPVLKDPMPGWRAVDYRIPAASLTRELVEGDVIDIGKRVLRVLALPGHSPGSIGLLDEAQGILFAGDAIYRGKIVDDLPHSDRDAYRVTMKRLARMETVALVCGGHSEVIQGAQMRKIARDWLVGQKSEFP